MSTKEPGTIPKKMYDRFAKMEDEINEVHRLAIELVKKSHDESYVRTIGLKIQKLTEK